MKLFLAKNITYSINENKLFHNLSFSVNAAECLHIKGGNGSGKSTLLRIILGITPPSKGLVESVGLDLVNLSSSGSLTAVTYNISHQWISARSAAMMTS